MKDYDFELYYHLGKANVVVDAFSRKTISNVASITIRKWEMWGAIGEFDLHLGESVESAALFTVVAQPTLMSRVIETQWGDLEVEALWEKISSGKVEKGLNVYFDSSVGYLDYLFVSESCRVEVLQEFHHLHLAVHPGGTKIYRELSHQF